MKTFLENALHYELSQWLWYRPGKQAEYIGTYVRPDSSSRILDIGCGTGNLTPLLSYAKYLGFDLNPGYIRRANARKLPNTKFQVADILSPPSIESGSFDIVMANGILHHLDDRGCKTLLEFAANALTPGGRLITRDGCFTPAQGGLERWLLSNDRGHFVRAPEAYDELFDQTFKNRDFTIRHDLLRTPYSMIIFSCTK